MTHTFFEKSYTINCNGNLLDLSMAKVMGIINITPDSFYSASRTIDEFLISEKVEQMLVDGADIIDLGAYSSRPGAKHISESEEWERLSKPLELIRKRFPEIILSVDTFRSSIAKMAVRNYSVDIINDISAGEMDANMFATIAKLNVPYIIMHMKGNPQNMQQSPLYHHLMKEVFLYFAKRIETLKSLGVSDIIIDPGFGFGKTMDHNYELLSKLDEFKIFEVPVLVGLSRKSMIYKYLNNTPEESLNGTVTLNTIALTKGAQILRVHDVKEAVESVKLFNKMNLNYST